MTPATTLTLVDGVQIVVPDSLNLITPYVLMEQLDWFEDEIKFLRRLLQPGQKVIDIGANYGVYSLSMAKKIGATGCVWAFEPASSTARLFAEGIAANGFTQIVLERSALSDKCGSAQLALHNDSEMNALVHDGQLYGAYETVPVGTLDNCMESLGWNDIEFIKIDAEGEETNILKGGVRFFSELSPLVQYEIKIGENLHLELVQEFAALGYESYRLVPGLDLLVPFGSEFPPDGYLLNLFCCKQDRAEQLAANGYLVNFVADIQAAAAGSSAAIAEMIKAPGYDWRHTLAKMSYGAQLADVWEQTGGAAGNSVEVGVALACYALSRDVGRSACVRFGALKAGFNMFYNLCMRQPTYLRLASLARVAREFGARSIAVDSLLKLGNAILEHRHADPKEPFLAPGERFDSVNPGDAIGNWILAAVLEELERIEFFSSYYSGTAAEQRLKFILSLGFGSEEMQRRLHLLQKRFGLPLT